MIRMKRQRLDGNRPKMMKDRFPKLALLAFLQEVLAMPDITVRQLSKELHEALKVQAKNNGRSMEAEVRAIIESNVKIPSNPLVELYQATRDDPFELQLPARTVDDPRVEFS